MVAWSWTDTLLTVYAGFFTVSFLVLISIIIRSIYSGLITFPTTLFKTICPQCRSEYWVVERGNQRFCTNCKLYF